MPPFAVLVGEARRGEERPAVSAVPEQPRTHDRPLVARQIGPRIVVHVGRLLPVAATQQRGTPTARERRGEKGDRVGRAARRAIQQELPCWLSGGTPREQIDDAAHGAGAVQRRRHALDDFDLPEIHRRDLQQAEPAHVTEQRQAVRQDPGVPAAHALNPHAGRAERRRGRLHAHAAHFVQHHDDVAGRHEHLFFDLFAREHFDAHRLIFETFVGARRRHDGDRFLDGRLRLQLDDNVLHGTGSDLNGCRRGSEARFDDGEVDRAWSGRQAAVPEASVRRIPARRPPHPRPACLRREPERESLPLRLSGHGCDGQSNTNTLSAAAMSA